MSGFVLDWRRQSDRHVYTVAWQSGDQKRTLLRVTGNGNCVVDRRPWPTDPPLQQVHHVSDELTLAVGMAGKNHWSLSIELSANCVVFDAACRVHEPVELGSVYDTIETTFRWDSDGLDLIARDGPDLFRLKSDANAWATSRSHVLLRVPNDGASVPTTARWKYSLLHTPCDD